MMTSHPSRVRELKRDDVLPRDRDHGSHPSRVRELKHAYESSRVQGLGVAPLPGA